MKKYIISLLVLLFFFCIIWLLKDDNDVDYRINRVNNNLLTMNLEQTAGKGDYKEVKDSSWPSEDYVFNSKLSRCENGGELSWDDAKKQVIFESSQSDRCYVYFDKPIPLVNYVINQYTGVQGENGLYHHDGTLENGIDDGSYRYAGANPNNFVCFGTSVSACPDENLYRIIGVIDGKVKLIKNISIGKYAWDENGSNIWAEATLNDYLNGTYLNSFDSNWVDKIETTTWKVGGNTFNNIEIVISSITYKNEILSPNINTTYNAKIGLMYVSDYGFSAPEDKWKFNVQSYFHHIKDVVWLYGLYEWTITRNSSDNIKAFRIFNSSEPLLFSASVKDINDIRPVFFLPASVAYISGTGTQTDPIRIK